MGEYAGSCGAAEYLQQTLSPVNDTLRSCSFISDMIMQCFLSSCSGDMRSPNGENELEHKGVRFHAVVFMGAL